MRLRLQAIEILRKRNKKKQPCNEHWKKYDDWVINHFKNETKCNMPYHEEEKSLSICNTQQLMKLSIFPLNMPVAEGHKYITPCKTLENVGIDYVESDMEKATDDSVGEFWFSISFPPHTFKEIEQARYEIFYI